jgi:hypothetical protein
MFHHQKRGKNINIKKTNKCCEDVPEVVPFGDDSVKSKLHY